MIDDEPNEVSFRYEKSNLFRVIHVDGAFGGVTPSGHLSIAFYNERHPLPRVTTLKLRDDGRPVGKEEVKERLDGLFREVEVNAFMDVASSITFLYWLEDKIEALRRHHDISEADWKTFKESIRAR